MSATAGLRKFEVVGWRFETSGEGGDLRVNLTLRETSEAAFSWNAEETEIIHNNTSLLPYTSAPSVGINVVGDIQISNEKGVKHRHRDSDQREGI